MTAEPATAQAAAPAPAAATRPPVAPEARRERPRPRPKRPERFLWSFPDEAPSAKTPTPLRHAPAVDANGRIFLHLGDRLVALQQQDGPPKLCWDYVTGCRAPGPVVIGPDGHLRLHCGDGTLHCLTAAGKQVWMPANVGEPLGYAAPMVDAQGNTYVGAYSGGLIKVDANGRAPKGACYFLARQRLDSGGLIHEGVLYVGSEEGYVFAVALDGPKGRNLWNHAGGQGETGWYIRCTPALSEDKILVFAGCDEHLYGFRLDGQLAWKTPMPGQVLGSPVLDRFGHIYVGVSQAQRGQPPRGLLVCVDGNAHKIRWEYKAAGPVESTPVIGSDERVYFGDNAGVIHAVDFRGNVQWTAQVEAAVRSAGTILAPKRLAFGLDNETLVVLECSSASLAESGWPKIGKTLGQCGLVQ